MNKKNTKSVSQEPVLGLGKVCGLDVHKKTCTAAIVSDDKPPIVMEGLENNGPGMNHLYQRLVEEGCRTVVMESTGPYWIGAYDYLELRGIHTVLVCPRSMQAIKGKKTDEHDSTWLAHLYRLGLVEPSYVPPRHIRELRSLTRRLEKIGYMITRLKLSILSQIDAFSTGITTTYTDPFGLNGTRIMKTLAQNMDQNNRRKGGIDVEKTISQLKEEGLPADKLEYVEKMLRLSFDPTSQGWLIEQGLETIQALRDQRDRLLDRIARHVKQHRDLSRYVEILLSISGINLVSAATITAELGNPTRFQDGKALSSYFGLVPSVEQSGPKTVLGRITKRGSPHMRRILCQVAQVNAAKGAPHLKRWYAQVKKRRGSKKAIVALGRKILVISWAMLRDNTTYQDPDQPEQTHQHTALHRHKLQAMKERAQRSTRTTSIWEAIHHLSTDQKLRNELGLITIKPTTQKPV